MLTEQHFHQLTAISAEIIVERGYTSIAPSSVHDWRALTEPMSIHTDKLLKQVLHGGALAFPLYRCGEDQPFTWILRPDIPRKNKEGKTIKYEYPRGYDNVLDVLPRYASALRDPDIPVWITEGAKKSDALASLYGDEIVPVNENGVWGWRTKGKVLDDFKKIIWEGRRVVIAPDGDVRHNRAVHQAVQRTAKLLMAWGAAEVLICLLPQEKSGPKLGIDDFIAGGAVAADIDRHLVEMAVVGNEARVALMKHPRTGEPLFLPPGYDVRGKRIYRRKSEDFSSPLYSGIIAVLETGTDIHAQDEYATVAWHGGGPACEMTVKRSILASGRGCAEEIGGRGANIQAENARGISAFLTEFVAENYDALPRILYSDRLGIAGEGLILPAGQINLPGECRYTGSAIRVGADAEAYPRALAEAMTWPDAFSFWLTLGLALSGPMVARLRPRRNPVLYLAGASTSGKTTAAQFACGAFGDPIRHPFRIEAGRTSPAGIFQTMEHLGGLPSLLDDAHVIKDLHRLEMACYSFANGQRYTVGHADGKARGGGDIAGSLLMAGEAQPEFKHAGSNLRVLWADCGMFRPLGSDAPPRSEVGLQRAVVLQRAWEQGAGLFGHALCERVWANFAAFESAVKDTAALPELAPIHSWKVPLAIAWESLRAALGIAGIRTLPTSWDYMIQWWVEVLTSGQEESDAASAAFESIIIMLTQAQREDDAIREHGQVVEAATWEWLEINRQAVACRLVGEPYWRVYSSTPQIKERIGPMSIQLYGQTWIERKWIVPAPGGGATHKKGSHNQRGTARFVIIPVDVLLHWN